MRKVLIANRGEIAVRVSRACRDAGITSVAVYAEPDRDAMHVCAADEAFALGGDSPATSYLDVAKVLKAAADSGADAVHPGYGFLSDNAEFAQAVLDAGLIWIGPPPQALRTLTDKISTRDLARRAGAPPHARTPNPDRARHVETQCLADRHGTVVVVSTRDCSLRRRGRTLVAEAPAPFLTPAQDSLLRAASKAILTEAGYVGAGTCEFLLAPDGTISFIGVNTGLRVEHPATEEITGIDLVREQFRIADGAALGYDDPEIRGHAIEFRIYGEDPGRDFLPTPGTVRVFIPPSGPGVRLDTGVRPGTVVRPGWDPLLAKLIVTGATRTQALQRATRALAEFTVDGLATVIPFHRAVVTDPAFSGEALGVHTRWIESEFDHRIAPYAGAGTETELGTGRETVVVEIGGKRIEVTVPAALAGAAANSLAAGTRRPQRGSAQKSALSGDTLAAPMQGTVLKIAVRDGQQVVAGQLVVVLEAMKMEQPLRAHKAGTIVGLQAVIGQSVSTGAALCEIKD